MKFIQSALLLILALAIGCDNDNRATNGGSGGSSNAIVIDGSDTMVNLSQAWAEGYRKTHPDVKIEVSGNGTGVGINKLTAGQISLANASRKLSESEISKIKAKFGKDPKEFVLGLDALALYVHKDNPLETISMEELAEVYGENGKIDKWTQLGKSNPACPKDEIVRVSRQNSSGTYTYFRDHVLGKGRDFKPGANFQSGSKDVVQLVSTTPCSIGYSGMGYKIDAVKWLSVSKKKGEPPVAPSPNAARDGSYPISRPLLIYTVGEPEGAVKDFLEWCKTPEGQKVVADVGYVPL